MTCFRTPASVDQQIDMSNSVNPTDQSPKLRHKKAPNSPNHLSICQQQSRWAAIDFLVLIAVITALGFLLIPHIKLLTFHTIAIVGGLTYMIKEEVFGAPIIYGCLGASVLCTMVAVMGMAVCLSRKCGRPGCRGLREGAKFDIQLETEESLRNSGGLLGRESVKEGVFVLARDHHRELETELKKMAPPNGRAVLLFRGRCGCSVGRMEVPGPKKPPRKVEMDHVRCDCPDMLFSPQV